MEQRILYVTFGGITDNIIFTSNKSDPSEGIYNAMAVNNYSSSMTYKIPFDEFNPKMTQHQCYELEESLNG